MTGAPAVASMGILQAIGNTSMVRLRRVVPPRSADILFKLEWDSGLKYSSTDVYRRG